MKLEKLKKNNKKKILIGGVIVFVLISAIGFTSTRAKYKSIQNLKLATGNIKIQEKFDFKIIAMYQSDDGINYNEIDTMPSNGYIVNEEKSYCTTDNQTKIKGKVKTTNGIHGLYNLNKNDKCYIWFDKVNQSEQTLAKLYINDVKTGIPSFSTAATTDEGIYSTTDGMYGGTSYYWRGAATTNHVIFANFCWRIVRINGDGTIRLIYNGAVQSGNKCFGNGKNTDSIAISSQIYNSVNDRSEYVGWTYSRGSQRTTGGTASNAKTQTEKWFNNNITGNNLNKVANGKFCNDRNVASGYTWTSQATSTFFYAANERIKKYAPTLNCPSGDKYTLKVGLITADEAMFAGANGSANDKYYLYNGQYYWTMSPNCAGHTIMMLVHSNGDINGVNDVAYPFGLRPVINLNADVTFNLCSDGTQDNPYIVR